MSLSGRKSQGILIPIFHMYVAKTAAEFLNRYNSLEKETNLGLLSLGSVFSLRKAQHFVWKTRGNPEDDLTKRKREEKTIECVPFIVKRHL